ncbi:MAG TPA: outer membrane beta-barrel protein [Novosphingobium sp.]|nr:outer membrane beta-barrel protein [Novosphingobium sp.]
MRKHHLQIACVMIAASCLLSARSTFAQSSDTVLLEPLVPPGFENGQETSVALEPRPEYDALGLMVGGFKILPSVETRLEVTSNTYLSPVNPVLAPVIEFNPQIDVRSQWSRHFLHFLGRSNSSRYIGEARRNEDTWRLQADGALNVTREVSIKPLISIAQVALDRFSGDVTGDIAGVSNYRQNAAALEGTYTAGRGRATLIGEYYGLNFSSVQLTDGSTVDQSALNRKVYSLTMRFEYAASPDFLLYAQGSAAKIDSASTSVGQLALADSTGGRVQAGTRVNLPGFGSALFAVGYTRRKYDILPERTVSGISAEARVLVNPSALTTITFDLGRRLSDTQSISGNPFMQSRARLAVDHSLLYNLFINASVSLSKEDYKGNRQRSGSTSFFVGAKYLATRRYQLNLDMAYGKRRPDRGDSSRDLSELRVGAGVTFKL